jgi:signal transduction histidine kinase
MTTDRIPLLPQALRRRGYPFSPWPWRAWPWRALAYLVTTVPVAAVLSLGMLVFVAPMLAVLSSVRQDRPVELPLVVFLSLVALGLLAVAPLVSVPVSLLERRRLILVDPRPLPAPRTRGLAARYTSPAAWLEVGYAFLLGGVVPIVYGLVAFGILLDLVLIATPWLVDDGDRIVMGWASADTALEAVPWAVAGVLLLPVLWYLLTVLAAAQAAAARRLLAGPADSPALREVAQSRARLVGAYEAERGRIERDVHDGAQPRLTSISLHLGLARLDVPDDSPAAAPLATAHEQAKSLLVTLRQIVRGIRPQSLTELGLAGAVRELAGESTVPVTVTAAVDRPLPEAVETTAYFVVSEALSNVERHAGAARAEVHLSLSGRDLVVEVRDDGTGGADPHAGTGLTGLADRVAASDGRLLLASPPGGPTVLRVELPCH